MASFSWLFLEITVNLALLLVAARLASWCQVRGPGAASKNSKSQ